MQVARYDGNLTICSLSFVFDVSSHLYQDRVSTETRTVVDQLWKNVKANWTLKQQHNTNWTLKQQHNTESE